MTSLPQRVLYLDRMRAFWVAMMVIDHGIQGYAQTFGRFWFFEDAQRSAWCDAAHVFFNALLMPPLFLIAGLWVVPHLQRDGVGLFLKKRFYRLGMPFVVGVIFLVPLMTFPRYHVSVNPYDSYFSFWGGPFIWSSLQAGPFWFLGYLMILTSLAAFLYHKAFWVLEALKRLMMWVSTSPYQALCASLVFFACLQGVSDLMWGAPYWVSMRGIWDPYGKLIAVQGSRFLLQACYFFIGVGLGQTRILSHLHQRMRDRPNAWIVWCMLFAGVSALYITCAQPFDVNGAHGHRFTFMETIHECTLWPILVRTSLQPIVCLLATGVGLMVLMRYESYGHRFWGYWVPYAYSIYFIHEVLTVWVHYGFSDTSWPLVMKLLIASFGVLGGAWALSRWVLPRLPILGPVFHNG